MVGLLESLPIKSLNNKGCIVNEMAIAERIPIIETTEIEFKAGCFAKSKTPNPKIVVITDKKIDVLAVKNFFLLILYSCSNPFVIKML